MSKENTFKNSYETYVGRITKEELLKFVIVEFKNYLKSDSADLSLNQDFKKVYGREKSRTIFLECIIIMRKI